MKPLLILFFLASTLLAFSQTDTINQLDSFETKEYKIQYPLGSTLDTSKFMGMDFAIYLQKENGINDFRENINLVSQDLNGQTISLDEFARITEKQFKAMANDLKIYESKKMKLGNKEYYIDIYGMTQGVYKLKLEQYYFIKNNKVYILTFTTKIDTFDTFKNIGEEIMNSFVIK